MGKSDDIIFQEYLRILENVKSNSVAFLGFRQENPFTKCIPGDRRDFYDLSLGNWNINDDWQLDFRDYDLIVCTRCAYFSKEPQIFIEKCRSHLALDGHALIDWGLGDHWRFKKYKVGWVKDGEHEYAYEDNNLLFSCYWNDEVASRRETQEFWNFAITSGRYSQSCSLEDVILQEVPALVDYPVKKLVTKFLWPESPQLYIITLIQK